MINMSCGDVHISSPMFQRFLCLVVLFLMTILLYIITDSSESNSLSATGILAPKFAVDRTSVSQPTPVKVDNYGIPSYRCLEKDRFNKLYTVINETKIKIWEEWKISNFPLFLSLMDIPRRSWDIQKHKFVRMILDESVANKTFVAGFSGSSVTAGHDNFFKEAYPQVFHDTMAPVMRAIGVKFEVRNQALGNNPCYPYDACVATHMGTDVDLLTWEQSMNCGRDARPVETFIRAAFRLQNRPAVMFLSSGTPVWTRKECENVSSVRTTPLTDKEKQLLGLPVKDYVHDANILGSMAFMKTGSYALYDAYGGVSPMAQSVLPVDAYKCKGPYGADFSEKTPGGGVAWHPGMRGHKLKGQNVAYFILEILLDAMSVIEPTVAACKPPAIESTVSSSTTSTSSTTSSTAASSTTSSTTSRTPSTSTTTATSVAPLTSVGSSNEGVHRRTIDVEAEDGRPKNHDRDRRIPRASLGGAAVGTVGGTEGDSSGTSVVSDLRAKARLAHGGHSSVVHTSVGHNSVGSGPGSGGHSNRRVSNHDASLNSSHTSKGDIDAATAAAIEEARSPFAGMVVHSQFTGLSNASATSSSNRSNSSDGGISSSTKTDELKEKSARPKRPTTLRMIVEAANRYLDLNLVGEIPDPLVCGREDCLTDAFCFTDFEPRRANSLTSRLVNGPGNWTQELSFFDKQAVAKAAAKGMGYIDRKNIFISQHQGDAISLLVSNSRTNPVWLCEVQKGFLKYPATMGDLDKAAALYADKNVKGDVATGGAYSPKRGYSLSLTLAADQCYRTPPLPPGTHVLTLVQKGAQQINLAYLLYW